VHHLEENPVDTRVGVPHCERGRFRGRVSRSAPGVTWDAAKLLAERVRRDARSKEPLPTATEIFLARIFSRLST